MSPTSSSVQGIWHLAELEQNGELLVGGVLWERAQGKRRRADEVTFQRKKCDLGKVASMGSPENAE